MPRPKGSPKTGGRARGTPNRRTVIANVIRDKALSEGKTPLQVMLETMRELYDAGDKVGAAKIAHDAAPFVHSRVTPRDDPISLPSLDDSLADSGRTIIECLGRGELTPGEAQTIMQVLAAQARIIAIDEIEKRISSLEQVLKGGNDKARGVTP